MMKRLVSGLLALIALLTLCFGVAAAEGTNLVTNGGFENKDASGEPDGWYTSAYRTQEGYTRFEVSAEKAHSGLYSAKITNANTNDARFVYSLTVKPESMYKFSGYILVDSMEDFGNGANLAIEDVYSFSETVYDTQGQWKYVEWYGETGEGQTEVLLDVRIGGYGAESQGIAYFDDISVEEVSALPDGVIASLWYTVDDGGSDAGAQSDATANTPQKSTLLFLLLAGVFVILATLGSRELRRTEPDGQAKSRATLFLFALALIGAFVLRILLASRVLGYQVDMNCFSAWSLRMASVGPLNFYSQDVFCDYPPGYMLLLWPVGLLVKAVGYAESPEIRLIIKSIPILCDMVAAIVLFAYAKKRVPLKAAVLVSLLFALNPAALVNGAAWGQVDTLLSLLLLLTAIAAMENNWRMALPLFTIAVLTKPQALLFAPVGGIWLLLAMIFTDSKKRRAQWKGIWQGLLIALGCAVAIVLPFSLSQSDPLWLFKLYQKTMSSYNYASLNTANLMYLLGGNWSHLDAGEGYQITTLSGWIPAATGVLLLAAAAIPLLKRRMAGMPDHETAQQADAPKAAEVHLAHGKNAQGTASMRDMGRAIRRLFAKEGAGEVGRKAALLLLCALFGLAFLISSLFPCTFRIYGTLWMAFVYLFALLGLIADRRADTLPFHMTLMLMGVYVFGMMIHERYLFAALTLLPLGYVRTHDRRLLWLCVGFSVTTFLNTAIVLDNSILFGSAMGHLNSDTLALNDALCVLNILLCVYAGWVAYTGLAPSAQTDTARVPKTNACYRNGLLEPMDAKLRLIGRDFLIMGITMVLYAGLAFFNLGSTKAPQTAWVATGADEQVVFELDKEQTFKTLYYAGVSYNNFSISVSSDGVNWSQAYPCEMREGLCYRWNYALTSVDQGAGSVKFNDNNPDNLLWLTGKYLRVNADMAGLNLWEIILRDEAGNQIPLKLVDHTGAKDVLETAKPPENLIDEQNTLEGEPSWYNGTYFDEIYHARTAYEHLHGLVPYETTHPPLGKLMMSVGIAMFGMTPFGWRFMGALIGVLMLPALYLLTKQLTRKRGLATFAMLLFALDLMHYTQTRIATIDSFPVFFIILSTLCMVRYLQTDVHAIPVGITPEMKPRVMTRPFLRSLMPLMLCGLFMGLSIASKWIGLYSAVGLAVMFLIAVYRQFRTGLVAFDVDIEQTMTPMQKLRVLWARELTIRRILVTCAFCLLFFIAVPALIYYLSYIPYLSPSGPVTLERIVKAQVGMYNYQSTPGLGMDHPFNSPWWQWPLILKPMWFSQDKFEPTGFASTIMCMGNPLIFYIGAACMVALFGLYAHKYVGFRGGLRLKQGDGNLTVALIVLGFLTQYLPWVLVPRSMYMYHYFASVPFIILATTYVFNLLPNAKVKKIAMIVYVVLAAVFFAMFYPYASGLLTPTWWMDWLKWFPKLYY